MHTPTGAAVAERGDPVGDGAPQDRSRSLPLTGWLPPALLLVATFAVLWFYAVPPATTAVFLLYLGLGVTLPGTLWWRFFHRGKGWFVADVAAGLALGYVGEVFCYVAARWAGVPLLVLVWPLATVTVFVAVPGLRRYWRSAPDAERPPTLWRWALTGIAGLILLWSCKFYRSYGLRFPYNSTPDTDSTFHLALVGEAKHHMPMVVPWITGEPLYYHWFVYPEMAATSWVTGIEPNVLLLRLSVLPMLMAFAVLVAVLARKLTGGWWTGIAASVVTLFVLAPNPFGWHMRPVYEKLAFSPLEDGSSLRLTVWSGPTQTFGALLFVPVMLVLVDRLREPVRQGDRRGWVLLAILLAGVMGGKATYPPLLFCGLLLALAVELVFRRRLHGGALTALGLTGVAFVFSQLVLFGSTSQGSAFNALTVVVTSPLGMTTQYVAFLPQDHLNVLAALTIFGWCCVWAGLVGLFRRSARSPEIMVMLGIGLSGAGATLLTGQSGDSQRFFIEAARPYIAVAAVVGLAALLPAGRMTWKRGAALAGSAVLGILVVQLVQAYGRTTVPTRSNMPNDAAWRHEIVVPYAQLGLAAALFLGGLVVASVLLRRRGRSFGFGTALALTIALLAGYGLNTTAENYNVIARDSRAQGWRNVVQGTQIVSEGTLEAGRWLREHSDPTDLVATNAHCLVLEAGKCSNLHFSMTAYSERRMLVEGWGFSTTAHEEAARLGLWVGYVPYWKPEVLADNDAVFKDPTAENIATLRDRYGVKWLFVDESQGGVSPKLLTLATERYRSGPCVVYQLARF
ncbi:hypothetical protein KZZ52_58485 [Dactylosporangium sp. AC04546]|uniref:hypothetical protein n=1 Tax=Dactylosporangium sp. AC04546 TaxID=2862460 RepID=UPI001EDE2A1F|nr:hypothetical protein [Dactylosporangium sp. AC04546]WVK83587.1 hypothetical protein KZZ52_58485 [Dactylosporangium sp. AC04546]